MSEQLKDDILIGVLCTMCFAVGIGLGTFFGYEYAKGVQLQAVFKSSPAK